MSAAPPANLVEAHAHVFALGQSLELTPLDRCATVAKSLDAVRRASASSRPSSDGRAWVRLFGARVESWDQGRWPTLAELDAACAGACVVIMSFDYHCAMASSAAMAAAGVRAGVAVGTNGVVCTDAQGQATGVLLEDAAYAVWKAAPEPVESERERLVILALAHLRSLGFAEVHDLHSQAWLGPMLGRLDREGRLGMRVALYPNVAEVRAVAEHRQHWESTRVRLAGGKVFSDGTLSSRTALMIHRYAEPRPDMPRGHAMVAPVFIDEALRTVESLDLQLAVHAIGDGAVRMVLDSAQRVRPARGTLRIEHLEVLDAADVPRFVELGVTASVQPCHLLTDIEALRRYVPHRIERVLPLRSLLASGLEPGVIGTRRDGRAGLVFGSDAPIVRANPEDSIFAAVHRRRPGMPQDEAIAMKEALDEAAAWRCFARVCDETTDRR